MSAWPALCLLLVGFLTPEADPHEPRGVPRQTPATEEKPARVDAYGDPLPSGAVARLGTLRLRSTATALALSPDGKTLLTSTGGRTIARVDPESGRLRDELYLPGPFTDGHWFSPDAHTLAVAEEHTLVLWEPATGKRLREFAVEALHVAFTADGRTLATAEYEKEDGRIRLWDPSTGKDRLLAHLPSYANDLAFSADGKYLFAAVDNHSLRCWDTASGRQLWQNDHWASKLAVAPDGNTLCTDTYQAGPLHLWNALNGKELAPLGEERLWTVQLAFSPDGLTVAQGTPKETLLWDMAGRKLRVRLAGAGPNVAFTADSRSLFTAGSLLLRHDVASGKLLYPDTRTDGHIGTVATLAFAPNGRRLASCGADGTVRLWDLAGGHQRLLHGDASSDHVVFLRGREDTFAGTMIPLQFSPNGRLLLASSAPNSVALTDVATGEDVRRFQFARHDKAWPAISTARLTADGRTLVALGSVLRLTFSIDLNPPQPLAAWDVTTGREVLSRMVPTAVPAGAEISPDGRLVVTPESNSFRDLRTERERPFVDQSGRYGPPAAFSPDGRLLAAAEPGWYFGPAQAIRVYEVLTGRLLARVKGPLGYCHALGFSPDGRLLAASGTDALYAWEASTGRKLLQREGPGQLPHWASTGFASCLAFAPDGMTLATGHADGTILVWDLKPTRKDLTVPAAADPVACWDDLAGKDAGKAYAAIERLAASPSVALPLLRRHLKAEHVEAAWLADRLADLDSASFETRESATRELERVGGAVETELRRAREKTTALEVRNRLDRVLETLQVDQTGVPSTDEVRRLRAVQVLERIGTEGRTLLRELADGAPDARLTQEAKAALERQRTSSP